MLLLLVLLLPATLFAIPIDNGVIGEPEIACGTDAIYVRFNTQNELKGHIYAKGYYDVPECRIGGLPNEYVSAIRVAFNNCGVRRSRLLNPRGISVAVTLVISFHPSLMTKVDRAYDIRCFYMEASKTLTAQIDVSEATPAILQGLHQVMPTCAYSVVRGEVPYGEPISYAAVGDKVYHQWSCSGDDAGLYCMHVHNCNADDGRGNKVALIDGTGCSVDRYLLQDLDYISDLAFGRAAHVFKYADRPTVFFECQVTLDLKDDGDRCPRENCRTLPTYTTTRPYDATRRQRSVTADVGTKEITVFEIGTASPQTDDRFNFNQSSSVQHGLCFQPNLVYSIGSLIAVVLLGCCGCAGYVVLNRREKKDKFGRPAFLHWPNFALA